MRISDWSSDVCSSDLSMAFAPSTLSAASCDDPDGIRELSIYSFGLFGPNGPLHLHLTEYARGRIHHHGDDTLTAFADVFYHRMIFLFYRACGYDQRDRQDAV